MEPALARRKALEPVQIAEAMNRLADVDIAVNVEGGGQMGQVDAIRTAIARGLFTTTVGLKELMRNSAMST